MLQKTIGQVLGIKYNRIDVTENGKIYFSRNIEQGIGQALYEVKNKLIDGQFENIITVSVDGAKGCFGPNVKPSKKGLKRLISLIKNTKYSVVQVNGQNFTLEGSN
jgi:hypothetical protein